MFSGIKKHYTILWAVVSSISVAKKLRPCQFAHHNEGKDSFYFPVLATMSGVAANGTGSRDQTECTSHVKFHILFGESSRHDIDSCQLCNQIKFKRKLNDFNLVHLPRPQAWHWCQMNEKFGQ